MYLNHKSLLLYLIILSCVDSMVLGRSYETGELLRDDYEYALEGIAVDYVTNRPKSGTISRIQKNRRRLNHLQNIKNKNRYHIASSLPSSLSSLSSSSSASSSSSLSTKNTIIYRHKSSMYG